MKKKEYFIVVLLLISLLVPAGQAKAGFVGWALRHAGRAALVASSGVAGYLAGEAVTDAAPLVRASAEGAAYLVGRRAGEQIRAVAAVGTAYIDAANNQVRRIFNLGDQEQTSTPSSDSSPVSSSYGSGGVAVYSGSSSNGSYAVVSTGSLSQDFLENNNRCTYLSLPVVVQTSSKAQEIVVEIYDKEGKKIDGMFYRTILPNGTSKEGVPFNQIMFRPRGQTLDPNKEYKYKVWAKAIGDREGKNHYLETGYLKPSCDTQAILATLTFEKNTPTSQTTAQQEKKCYTFKEKGNDKEKYFYGTFIQFARHIISLDDQEKKFDEIVNTSAGPCPEGVEVITAEEEKPEGADDAEETAQDTDEDTQADGLEGAQSGPSVGVTGSEEDKTTTGASSATDTGTTADKDTPEGEETKPASEKSDANEDKAKVEEEAKTGLEDDDTKTSPTATDNALQEAIKDLQKEVGLLREDVAKLLARNNPEDVKKAGEAIENGEEETSEAVKKLVEELGYLKDTIVEANKALQEMVKTLKNNLSLPQLLTASNQGNPYAGLAADQIFSDAQDRGQTIMEIEELLARAMRWAYIAWAASSVDDVETDVYEKVIAIAKINLQGAEDKCSELGNSCTEQVKENINLVREIIESLPQTKTTSTSQQEEDNE